MVHSVYHRDYSVSDNLSERYGGSRTFVRFIIVLQSVTEYVGVVFQSVSYINEIK